MLVLAITLVPEFRVLVNITGMQSRISNATNVANATDFTLSGSSRDYETLVTLLLKSGCDGRDTSGLGRGRQD